LRSKTFNDNVLGMRAKYVADAIKAQTFVTAKLEKPVDSPDKDI